MVLMEKVASEILKNPKVFIYYSETIDEAKNLQDYYPTIERRVLIVFDDMIADMESNRTSSPIVTQLFLRGRKLNFSLVFISQACFKVLEIIRINAAHCFIMKISNISELCK